MPHEPAIAVVIPALNEARAIGQVIEEIPLWVSRVIVADNGSTDGTAEVAEAHGATVVREPRRGYGAACLRALAALDDPDIVVFLDADHSDFPAQMDRLIEPIVAGRAELVIGSRTVERAQKGALTWPQRTGNALASFLLRRLWGQPCSDLGPFRAIRFDALQALRMDDLGFGWTVQMQARALKQRMRVVEAPVAYRQRIGKSKISGTVRGVIGAGTKILTTIAREALPRYDAPFQRQRLIVFARYPEPGTTKTRLIPALGEQGAADLQRQMNHHTLNVARQWARLAGRHVEVRYAGGDATRMGQAFGDDLSYVDQGTGDLGDRLIHAFQHGHDDACDAVIAIGTDCPQLDTATIAHAFDALQDHDVVLGPASDGGYYLIGMRRPHAGLFDDIDWSTDRVLAQTRQRIDQLGLSLATLPTLDDVDEPADLPAWQRITPQPRTPRYTLIIPALNEAGTLNDTLASIAAAADTELILVDAGSSDATPDIARAHAARVIVSDPGRARQMNAGGAHARGDLLLFLHADTRLPFAWREHVQRAMQQPGVIGGAFRLGFTDARLTLRAIEAGANFRSRWRRLPYGDQAIFLRRTTFQRLAGYRDLPVMEDYEFIRRLRRTGRVRIASASVLTSPRRWLRHGTIRTTLLHQLMILAWHLRISPARLARWRAAPSAPTATRPDRDTSAHATPGAPHVRARTGPGDE